MERTWQPSLIASSICGSSVGDPICDVGHRVRLGGRAKQCPSPPLALRPRCRRPCTSFPSWLIGPYFQDVRTMWSSVPQELAYPPRKLSRKVLTPSSRLGPGRRIGTPRLTAGGVLATPECGRWGHTGDAATKSLCSPELLHLQTGRLIGCCGYGDGTNSRT